SRRARSAWCPWGPQWLDVGPAMAYDPPTQAHLAYVPVHGRVPGVVAAIPMRASVRALTLTRMAAQSPAARRRHRRRSMNGYDDGLASPRRARAVRPGSSVHEVSRRIGSLPPRRMQAGAKRRLRVESVHQDCEIGEADEAKGHRDGDQFVTGPEHRGADSPVYDADPSIPSLGRAGPLP